MTIEDASAYLTDLLDRTPDRVMIGLTGPPGAGKSTAAARLVADHPGAALVGMDAFHLASETLARLGTLERKGAPETFDADGYVALLRRLRAGEPRTVWAGEFRRELEETIAGVVAVPPQTRLVVTEGNYLLLAEEPWDRVQGLLDEVWYVDVAEDVRLARLVARHMAYGRDAASARDRATTGPDGANARLVAATRTRASVLIQDESAEV